MCKRRFHSGRYTFRFSPRPQWAVRPKSPVTRFDSRDTGMKRRNSTCNPHSKQRTVQYWSVGNGQGSVSTGTAAICKLPCGGGRMISPPRPKAPSRFRTFPTSVPVTGPGPHFGGAQPRPRLLYAMRTPPLVLGPPSLPWRESAALPITHRTDEVLLYRLNYSKNFRRGLAKKNRICHFICSSSLSRTLRRLHEARS